MKRGFYTILTAQFVSALADNALLFAAIALLRTLSAPAWHTPLLKEFFIIAYIVLAPFVGSFADAQPKGRVMFIANGIKLAGCMAMLFGLQPLYAYAIVGIGAATYSPAKYGILTEFLPPSLLVAANGWMEGATVAAIILGAILGGMLVNPQIIASLPGWHAISGLVSVPLMAVFIIALLYLVAAIINLFIPHVPIDHRLPQKSLAFVLHDFWHAFKLLWRDPQGRVSLAVTTLFWGAGATLQFVVLKWSEHALGFKEDKAAMLTAVVGLGIALGAMVAGRLVSLEKSVKVLPAGILMGLLVLGIIPINNWWLAAAMLCLIGALGGFFVVPLNALLQHRGHLLMGAGHSIAVQNFNENLGILVLLGAYAAMIGLDLHIGTIVALFGLFISLCMTVIYRSYREPA